MPIDPWGFTKHPRVEPPKRPVQERLADWDVVYRRPSLPLVREQARRCMGCGVPFCHGGCPLGNLIPDWNELVGDDRWADAIERLHATNNFPEFTGWLCPAPCEAACVLSISDQPVTIKQVELSIIDEAWDRGLVGPRPPERLSEASVAVVGSGPAGLAAAQQLTRAGHTVVVYERSDALGGLLRYGIPDFKMPKGHIDRRIEQMRAEGTRFCTGHDVGGAGLSVRDLRARFDAVVLAVGALEPRDVAYEGRDLEGVLQAMDYLPEANRVLAGKRPAPPVDAKGRHVVVIGGGDTAADCLGTANRQGAASVTLVDHNPRPAPLRDWIANPWPQWPRIARRSPAHEEGVQEEWATEVLSFVGDLGGHVRGVRVHEVRRTYVDGRRVFEPVEGTERELPADLVLLAAGFVGTGADELLGGLGVGVTPERGTVRVDGRWATDVPGVFSCGDASRGASLVVWAIADGRACAAAVDEHLTGERRLPAPVTPSDRPL
ncbi:glutamate synthase subunit beta [Vallicoccus soli]|uniref:Glutamate synthase subunit beta n=1 Tax=Vallicoccus soli TaxID=2339232 RepID=A0A3A3Z5W9_9ACTN|nr:glutamate synthase subunit beta [Vallicoccus soli]RJK98373.1 glutamate synthase subunit beta [Vallicoccus soli]